MNGYWVAVQGVLAGYRNNAAATTTVLLVSFPGGSTNDQSPANNGSATQTGAGTLSEGQYQITEVNSEARELSWSSADFRIDGGPLTVEYIVQANGDSPNPPTASTQLSRFIINDADNSDYFNVQIDGLVSSENNIAINRQTGVGSSSGQTGADDVMERDVHVALVFQSGGSFVYYIDGVRYTPSANTNPGAHAGTASLVIGGLNNVGQSTILTYKYVRISQSEVYTGASFTPPTSLGLYYP